VPAGLNTGALSGAKASSSRTRDNSVNRNRKKPSAISILAKTTRVLFGRDEYIKSISILLFFDLYNYNMNAVDRGDQLIVMNPRLRYYVREG
jgi:hypothetical protein